MSQPIIPSPDLQPLLTILGHLITQARQQAARTVDVIQVHTCWDVGRHIVEFEQGGSARAAYGQRLLPTLAQSLTAQFGKGFDASNLRHMRAFYLAFPIRDLWKFHKLKGQSLIKKPLKKWQLMKNLF